jgi:CelD/BcsL family acetyltransferase involved in cellulose biosynthesis
MQWAIAQKLEFVHLSTGIDASKSRWGPKETPFHDAITVGPRARSHALHSAAQLTRRARERPELRAFVERFAPIRSVE